MATLNQITATICDAIGKPFDEPLKERIKFSVKFYRAFLIRRDFERNSISREHYQRMTVKLQKVDKGDTCVVSLDCPVLRTVNKIPKPVRKKSDVPFKYVGEVGGTKSFVFTTLMELPYTLHNKYTSNIIRYDWINGYIYIFNSLKYKQIMTEDIIADPTLVKDDCSDVECYDDDTEFPIGDDMIETIISGLINNNLKILSPNDMEVTMNPEKLANPNNNII